MYNLLYIFFTLDPAWRGGGSYKYPTFGTFGTLCVHFTSVVLMVSELEGGGANILPL